MKTTHVTLLFLSVVTLASCRCLVPTPFNGYLSMEEQEELNDKLSSDATVQRIFAAKDFDVNNEYFRFSYIQYNTWPLCFLLGDGLSYEENGIRKTRFIQNHPTFTAPERQVLADKAAHYARAWGYEGRFIFYLFDENGEEVWKEVYCIR